MTQWGTNGDSRVYPSRSWDRSNQGFAFSTNLEGSLRTFLENIAVLLGPLIFEYQESTEMGFEKKGTYASTVHLAPKRTKPDR